MSRKEFIKRMDLTNYALIKPHEIRKMFTEFVYFNKTRALLPSSKFK